MKVRMCHVSNSSSSSFILYGLTQEQIDAIFEENDRIADRWYINQISDESIQMWTDMDNYQWYDFFEKIGIKNYKEREFL